MGAQLPDTMYHFCCAHSAQSIVQDHGVLRPTHVSWKDYDVLIVNRMRGQQFASGLTDAPTVVWLTTEADPDRKMIGLERSNSHESVCDRMEWRFVVDPHAIRNEHKLMPWRTFTMLYLPNREWRINLEFGRKVDTWWVAVAPIVTTKGAPYEQAAQQPVPGSPNDG